MTRHHASHRSVALAGTLVLLACTRPPPPAKRCADATPPAVSPAADVDDPAVTVLPAPSPFVPAPAGERPLDRTLWRCDSGVIIAFWGDHYVMTTPDYAMLAMGSSQIFARSEFALRYGPSGSFAPTGSYSVALRRTEWPYGQRRPIDYDEPPRTVAYTLVNDHLLILGAGKREPIECNAKFFAPELTEFMEARFGPAPR